MNETTSSLAMLIGIYAVFLSTVLPGIQKQCTTDPLKKLEDSEKSGHSAQNWRILFFQLTPMTGITLVLAVASLANLLKQLNTGQQLVTQIIAGATVVISLWLLALSVWYVYRLVQQNLKIRTALRRT